MLMLVRPRASLLLLRQGLQGSLSTTLQPPRRSLRQAVRCCAARAVGSSASGVPGRAKPPAGGDATRNGGLSEVYFYGLHGGFSGDAEKLARATAAADALARGEPPATTELVAVLASLPQGGRWEFIGRAVMRSPCGAEVALALFEDCFEEVQADGGDDFIIDGARSSLLAEKRFILSALLKRVPSSSPVLMELIARYQKTTSTAFRKPLLTRAARSPHVTDEELACLCTASVAVEKEVLEAAAGLDLRRSFFSLLLDRGDLVHPKYYKHALSATVRKALVRPEATETSRRELFAHRLADWAAHGAVYLECLEQLLDEAGHHPHDQGRAYQEFEGRIRGDVPVEHVLRLVEICKARQLWVPKDPKAGYFFRERTVFVRTGGPTRLFPSVKLLWMIPDRRALVERFLQRDESSGQVALREGCAEVLDDVLAMRGSCKQAVRAQLQALAVEVFAAASPESVCELLLRSHRVAAADGVPEMSREAQCLVLVAHMAWHQATMNTEHRDLYDAWKAMLGRCLPAVAAQFLDDRWPSVRGVSRLEELWVAAHADKLMAHAERCKELLESAVYEVDRTGYRNGMTSHAGYLSVLCRDTVELGSAADALTSTESLAGQLQLIQAAYAMLRACDGKNVWELRGSESNERGAQLLRDGVTAVLTNLLHRTLRVLETRAPGGADFPDVANVKAALDTVLEAANLRGGLQLIRRGGEVTALFLAVLDRCSEVLRYPQPPKDNRIALRTGDSHEPLKLLETICAAVKVLLWGEKHWYFYNRHRFAYLPLHDASPEAVRALWRWWCANALTHVDPDTFAPLHPTDRRDVADSEAEQLLYLNAVGGLPAFLLADEQQRAVAVAVKVARERPDHLTDVLEVLDPLGLTGAFLHASRTAGVDVALCRVDRRFPARWCARRVLAAAVGIRELLEECARTSDADQRIRLLTLAARALGNRIPAGSEQQDQLPLVASVLSHTEATTRNERGNLRADLYSTLKKIISVLVDASLEVPDDAVASEFVKSVAGTMLQFVTNDLSKRDSVGAEYFRSISQLICRMAFEGGPAGAAHPTTFYGGPHMPPPSPCPPAPEPSTQASLRLDLRAEWVALAVQIDKLLLKKSAGLLSCRPHATRLDGVLPELAWQSRWQEAARFGTLLHYVKPDAGWIVPQRLPWERLEAALGGEGEAVLVNARKTWHIVANKIRDGEGGVPLAGRDAAALLTAALRKASAADLLAFRVATESERGWVDQKGLVEGAAERVIEVMSLAGGDWASVPEVIEYISAAGQFLRRVADGALSLPRDVAVPVVEVLQQVVRCAVTRSGEYADVCTALRELRWELLRVMLQNAPASTALAAQCLEGMPRDLTLPGLSEGEVLLAHHLFGKVHHVTEARTEVELRRSLALVKQLLGLTPSAIYLPLVQALLGKNRDDVLGTFIGCAQGDVAGPLGPAVHNTGAPLVLSLTAAVLKALNSEKAQKATCLSLELGLGVEASTSAREAAVTQFMLSPTTGHAAVIGLLGSLLKDDDPAEDSRALVEAVVLQVSKTDGVWQVLKYLLRPAVLQKCAQHATAIHKEILRLLVESTCSDAAAVLQREWADRRALQTHVDVVDELVCLVAIRLARSDSTLPAALRDVLWEILEDAAAKDSGVSETSRLHLMGLRWVPVSPSRQQKLVTPMLMWWKTETDDEGSEFVPLLYNPILPPFRHEIPESDSADHTTALRLQALVRKAVDEAPTAQLRTLGAARPFWLDWRAAGGDVELETLGEMSALLMHPVDSLAQLQGIDGEAPDYDVRVRMGILVAEVYGAAAKLFFDKRHQETDSPVGRHIVQVVEKLVWTYVRSPAMCTPLRRYLSVVLRKLLQQLGSLAEPLLAAANLPAKHLLRQNNFTIF